MPIRPEMKARYPKDWDAIRARILERAGNKCEWCGVANKAFGYRDDKGGWHDVDVDELHQESPEPEGKLIRIVLTIAHVHDKRPEAVDEANLAALCQKCHLRHDAKDHASTARETRATKAGQLTIKETRRQ